MGPDVHVTWVNLWKGNYEIFYKRSTDGGTTWGPDTPLTKDTLASVEPSIAVSGANIYVVWKYVLQRDRSDIAKGGIEFIDRGPRGICYRRSTDKGTTWDSKILLSGKPIFAEYPSVGVSGVNVHVVWNDLHDNPKYLSLNECLIYYKHSTDGGRTWRPETCLTTFPSPTTHPSIAVSGSNIHVVWEDKRERDENTEIYYKHSDDGGLTWCQDVRLMNYINPSNSPSIAVTGAKLHFVWLIALSNIYYSHSGDGGMNWKSVTNLTGQNSYAKQPSVAISGSKVHLVWCDHRDGNWEIYYKRNPTGNK
jgi:Neuraminidase (sialidase)